jgi:ABC-type Na+ transport system ATPase subunit NatA
MSIPSFTPNVGDARSSTLKFFTTTPATDATAAAVTFTPAQVLGGLILRDPNGAGRADLLPTAATLLAAIEGPMVGLSFEFVIRNTADAAETITVTTNTGLTLSGTMTIAQNNSKRFLARITAVGAGLEAVTVYSLGTVVH